MTMALVWVMRTTGDAIANNTNLLSLDIQEFGDTEMVVATDQWLFDVFRGLARNRSI
jgi:hypothetical protein